MKKLKLKKSVISALSSTEQERIIGGNENTIVIDNPALTGSRLIYCGTKNDKCTKSCKAPICIPI